MARSPEIQKFVDKLVESAGIPDYVIDGAEHPGDCKCDVCLQYWAFGMGPEMDGRGGFNFGPFSHAEIREGMILHGKTEEDIAAAFTNWEQEASGDEDDDDNPLPLAPLDDPEEDEEDEEELEENWDYEADEGDFDDDEEEAGKGSQ